MALFAEALEVARRSGKLLMVTFGATWCPSCKSLHEGLESQVVNDRPVASQFVRVEIAISTLKDGRRLSVDSGNAVLRLVLGDAPQTKPRAVPFIAIVDPDNRTGTFARHLEDVEQGSGGGFDFDKVREILTAAEAHIRTGTTAPAEPGWFSRKLRRWFAI
jgi:thiol-disulfide isomerase/thioredoxin